MNSLSSFLISRHLVSRVPPFMKPNKMRSIFEVYGVVTRLYLAEEDTETKRKRKESGGNASKQFKEGWIEFSEKKIAKQVQNNFLFLLSSSFKAAYYCKVAESLNNTNIGGKKGSFYHDDIWNLKYLSGFK